MSELKILAPSISGPLGAQIDPVDVLVIPRSGTYVKGSVLEADIARVSDETTNAVLGDRGSGWVNMIAVTPNGARGRSRHVVLLEGGVRGRLTRARLEGLVWLFISGHAAGSPKMRPVIVGDVGTVHGKIVKGVLLDDKANWVLAAWNGNRWGQLYDPPISGGSSGVSGGSSGGTPPGDDTPVIGDSVAGIVIGDEVVKI